MKIGILNKLLGAIAILSCGACAKQSFEYKGIPGSNTLLGKRVSETFTQTKAQGEVDLLIVSDNSASMAPQQLKLGGRFQQFTQALNDIDYQIGFITTDVEADSEKSKGRLLKLKGKEHKILKAGEKNAHKLFLDTVTVGTDGSGNEQPLLASIMAFEKRNSENSGFFRTETDLAILILSDEDEKSTGGGTTAAEVVRSFENSWGTTKRLIAFGIVVRPGDKQCLDEQAAETTTPGAAYAYSAAELADLTGGGVFSICDNDYSDSLKAIGEKVRNLVFSIELAQEPVAGSVSVDISTGEQISFRVEGKRVIFSRAPQRGAQVVVSYNEPAKNVSTTK